jgi:serine/threonine protein kinase
VDYSPEACPPEFAQAFLDGDGPYFALQTSYDIWSLGMMFYEIGAGRGYFDGKTPIQITRELAQMEKMEIDSDIDMDGRFRSLVKSCLQVDPKKRPSIAQVLLHPYFLTTGVGPFGF